MRLVSDLPGLASCIVTQNVYSDNGKVLLLERGSEATGEYSAGMAQGQSRVFVLWSRIKTPTGVVINLDSPGADDLGTSGLPGMVNNHWWERLGAAALLTIVQDAIAYKTAAASNSVRVLSPCIRTRDKRPTTWPRPSCKAPSTLSRPCTKTRAIAAQSMWRAIWISVPSMHSSPAEAVAPAKTLARDAMVRELMRPLRDYLAEDGVTEVVINRPGEVFLENGPEWRRIAGARTSPWPDVYPSPMRLRPTQKQSIDSQKPILSAMPPDGERVQIVVPPACEHDTVSMSIRRPSSSIRTLQEYEESGAFDRYVWARSPEFAQRQADLDCVDRRLAQHLDRNELAKFLTLAVIEKKNIAFVGNTGSGKTR